MERSRILVLDDDELVLKATSCLLGRLCLEAVTCLDREEGVRTFTEDPQGFAAVIMDVVMPGLNVIEALVRIRRANPAALVILASGYDAREVRRRVGEEALGGFLSKPYAVEAVRAALEAVFDTAPQPRTL